MLFYSTSFPSSSLSFCFFSKALDVMECLVTEWQREQQRKRSLLESAKTSKNTQTQTQTLRHTDTDTDTNTYTRWYQLTWKPCLLFYCNRIIWEDDESRSTTNRKKNFWSRWCSCTLQLQIKLLIALSLLRFVCETASFFDPHLLFFIPAPLPLPHPPNPTSVTLLVLRFRTSNNNGYPLYLLVFKLNFCFAKIYKLSPPRPSSGNFSYRHWWVAVKQLIVLLNSFNIRQ